MIESITSPRGLVGPDLREELLGRRVRLEVLPDGLEDGVDGRGHRRLEVAWVDLPARVVGLEVAVRGVADRAAVLLVLVLCVVREKEGGGGAG